MSRPNILSPELQDVVWAQGSNPVENPSNGISYYGYDDRGTFLPLGAYTRRRSTNPPLASEPDYDLDQRRASRRQKTEPDKNTYLVARRPARAPTRTTTTVATSSSRATRRGSPGYITRINLDADGPHRVTLMATKATRPARHGANLPTIDGSTWDPWAEAAALHRRERAPAGGVWQGTLDVPSPVDDLPACSSAAAAYEGIQNDDRGNLYIVEDVGGTTTRSVRRDPNSFVYRFLPDGSRPT